MDDHEFNLELYCHLGGASCGWILVDGTDRVRGAFVQVPGIGVSVYRGMETCKALAVFNLVASLWIGLYALFIVFLLLSRLFR